MADGDLWQRYFLPLPYFKGGEVDLGASLSRGVRQRLGRRRAVDERANETIWALNALGGLDGVECSNPGGELQRSSVNYVRGRVFDEAPPQASRAQEALLELLRSDSRYTEGGEGTGSLAPFGSAEVSLPEPAVDAPAVVDLLPADAADYFIRFGKRMLRDDVEYRDLIARDGLPGLHIDGGPARKRSERACTSIPGGKEFRGDSPGTKRAKSS